MLAWNSGSLNFSFPKLEIYNLPTNGNADFDLISIRRKLFLDLLFLMLIKRDFFFFFVKIVFFFIIDLFDLCVIYFMHFYLLSRIKEKIRYLILFISLNLSWNSSFRIKKKIRYAWFRIGKFHGLLFQWRSIRMQMFPPRICTHCWTTTSMAFYERAVMELKLKFI